MNRAGRVGGKHANDKFGGPGAQGVDCAGHCNGWAAWDKGLAADYVIRGRVSSICTAAKCYEWSDEWRD